MSDEPKANQTNDQIPEFVAKALNVAVPILNIGGHAVADGNVVAQLAAITRRQTIQISTLFRAVRSLGVEETALNSIFLDECQEVASQVDAAAEAAKSKIIVAGAVPTNGHAKRFGNFKFPGV